MATFRDEIIKLAHANPGQVRAALLPILAKSKTAAISMRDIGKINRLTAQNDHNEAAYEYAKLMGRRKDSFKLQHIAALADLYGYTPSQLAELRHEITKPMYAAARLVMVKDTAGKPVSLYELLD